MKYCWHNAPYTGGEMAASGQDQVSSLPKLQARGIDGDLA